MNSNILKNWTGVNYSYRTFDKGVDVLWKATNIRKQAQISPVFCLSNTRWQMEINFFKKPAVVLHCRKIDKAEEFKYQICLMDIDNQVIKKMEGNELFYTGTYSVLAVDKKRFYPQNTLIVVCQVFIFEKMESEKRDKIPPGNESKGDVLCADLSSALETGKHSDVILKLRDATFPAHKMILSCRSKVFEAMFDHDTKENTENVVHLVDMDAAVAKMMLQYIYTGKAGEMSTDNMIPLYSVADKYSLLELLKQCREFIAGHMEVETVCDAAIAADLHSDDALMQTVQEFFGKNLKRIFQFEKHEREKMFERNPQLFFKLVEEAITQNDFI